MKLELHQEAPASWLREARVALGLTQLELANALSVTPSTVSRWETGAEPIGNAGMLRLAVAHLAATGRKCECQCQGKNHGASSTARDGRPGR